MSSASALIVSGPRRLSLADPQSDRCQELIVELGYVPSGGSDSEAVAILRSRQCYGPHLSSSFLDKGAHTPIYAHMHVIVKLGEIRSSRGSFSTLLKGREPTERKGEMP
jgi:hypothetical protein